MKFGKRLKLERKLKRLTQAGLAERVGCAQSTIVKLEKLPAESSIYASKIAKVLDVNLQWLLTGEGPKHGALQQSFTNSNTSKQNTPTSIPSLTYLQIKDHKKIIKDHLEGVKRVNTVTPPEIEKLSPEAFHIVMPDNSMEEQVPTRKTIFEGDSLVIDPSLPFEAGDIVLAINPKDGKACVRVLGIEDETHFHLAAFSGRHPLLHFEDEIDAVVIGCVVIKFETLKRCVE